MIYILYRRKGVFLFSLLTVIVGGRLLYILWAAEDKTPLLPGRTTDGHYQIEMQCAACHVNDGKGNGFTSSGVSNQACLACHGEDLSDFSDSHPVRKFKNPENAVFLQEIDAMRCVTCHREHNDKMTVDMGVTIPPDYCAHCHEVTLESNESHRDLGFHTCATAGCHNFHDNMALAPSFLLKHYGEPDVLEEPRVNPTDPLARWVEEGNERRASLSVPGPDVPEEYSGDEQINREWAESAHAGAGIGCADCHGSGEEFAAKPALSSCRRCHDAEFDTFLKGKHGMRLAHPGLGPMSPGMARREMVADAHHASVTCNSCHPTHRYDRQYAAEQACMNCHNDEHTRNYRNSAHARLWLAELGGSAPSGSGVSCATCHMPATRRGGHHFVTHDQNANLTPNEKMLRSVCNSCHGLQFSMDALSDRDLISANFAGRPGKTHPGIGWTVEAAIARGDEKIIKLKEYLESISQNEGQKNPSPTYKTKKKNENN